MLTHMSSGGNSDVMISPQVIFPPDHTHKPHCLEELFRLRKESCPNRRVYLLKLLGLTKCPDCSLPNFLVLTLLGKTIL